MNPVTIGHIIRVDGHGFEVQLVPQVKGSLGKEAQRVGQLGTYVIVPVGQSRLVGFVVGMSREEGGGEEAAVRVAVQLVGTIKDDRFSAGVNEYPIVGDGVHAARQDDFAIIFGTLDRMAAGSEHRRSFALGQFGLNPDFEVRVLGKEFFSKHAAVLGNSGSGKSCATARILQEIADLKGAQIVLFDMHGEYRAAFSGPDGKLDANVVHLGKDDLILPYWLLNYEELSQLFIDYSNPLYVDNQSSLLRRALQALKMETAKELGLQPELTIDTPIYFDLEQLKTYAENLNDARFVTNTDRYAFVNVALRSLPRLEQERVMLTRRCEFHQGQPEGETVHPLYHGKLVGLVNRLDVRLSDRRYDFALRPLRHAEGSRHFRDALAREQSPGKLSQVIVQLLNLLMGRGQPQTNVTIVDLSGIPYDMVDICVSLITRLLFEFNFWTPQEKRHPTLLVYEEAHHYIPRDTQSHSFARAAVERVAREGRKCGVTAMVISQRPSELSETVLSQCNNMVILRMNNPDDQHYIAKVVSDQFANFIRVLPTLRPGEGFVIGDSVLMPMRTLIYLPERQPQSGDFDFFKYWSSARTEDFTTKVVNAWWHQNRRLFT